MKGGRVAAGGLFLAGAMTLIGAYEGYSAKAYLDTGGVPTICYGATRGVRMGQTASVAECSAIFTRDLIEHETGMRACMKRPDAIPDKTYMAVLSFTYNVGVGASCKSTLMQLVNAGQLEAACNQLPRWVNDNGKVIRGLVNRRVTERKLCLEGLQ